MPSSVYITGPFDLGTGEMRAKGAWIPVGILGGFIILTSHINPEICSLDTVHQYIRLDFLLHGGMYSLLGYTVARYFSSRFRLSPLLLGFLTSLSCLLFGCLHEYYQLVMDGRGPDFLDLAADFAGGVMGAAICLLMFHPVSTPARKQLEAGPVLKCVSVLSTAGLFLCVLLFIPLALQALGKDTRTHVGTGARLRDTYPDQGIGRLPAVPSALKERENEMVRRQVIRQDRLLHPWQDLGEIRDNRYSRAHCTNWYQVQVPSSASGVDEAEYEFGRESRCTRTRGGNVISISSNAHAQDRTPLIAECKGRQLNSYVATIVNRTNPVAGLSWLEARELLCRRRTGWERVGRGSAPVSVVTTLRDASIIEHHIQSVFHEGLKRRIVKVAFASLVVAYVAEHPEAIGLLALKEAHQLRWIQQSHMCKVVPIRLVTRHPDSYF